jgi:hypothetical protein
MLAAQAAPGAGHDGHTALKVQFICLHGVCLLLDLRAFCHPLRVSTPRTLRGGGQRCSSPSDCAPHAQPLQTPAPIYPHLCGKGLWISMGHCYNKSQAIDFERFYFYACFLGSALSDKVVTNRVGKLCGQLSQPRIPGR